MFIVIYHHVQGACGCVHGIKLRYASEHWHWHPCGPLRVSVWVILQLCACVNDNVCRVGDRVFWGWDFLFLCWNWTCFALLMIGFYNIPSSSSPPLSLSLSLQQREEGVGCVTKGVVLICRCLRTVIAFQIVKYTLLIVQLKIKNLPPPPPPLPPATSAKRQKYKFQSSAPVLLHWLKGAARRRLKKKWTLFLPATSQRSQSRLRRPHETTRQRGNLPCPHSVATATPHLFYPVPLQARAARVHGPLLLAISANLLGRHRRSSASALLDLIHLQLQLFSTSYICSFSSSRPHTSAAWVASAASLTALSSNSSSMIYAAVHDLSTKWFRFANSCE